jgi:hypothetical protein
LPRVKTLNGKQFCDFETGCRGFESHQAHQI